MKEQGLVSTYTLVLFKPHTKSCNESEQTNELNRAFGNDGSCKRFDIRKSQAKMPYSFIVHSPPSRSTCVNTTSRKYLSNHNKLLYLYISYCDYYINGHKEKDTLKVSAPLIISYFNTLFNCSFNTSIEEI